MRKIVFALFAVVTLLAGCASDPAAPPPTVAQVTAQLCPIAKEAGLILMAPGVLSVDDQAIITKAAPAVEKMCALGAVVVITDLKSFAADSLPAILDMVNASTTMDATKKARIGAGLLIAQLAIGSLR